MNDIMKCISMQNTRTQFLPVKTNNKNENANDLKSIFISDIVSLCKYIKTSIANFVHSNGCDAFQHTCA